MNLPTATTVTIDKVSYLDGGASPQFADFAGLHDVIPLHRSRAMPLRCRHVAAVVVITLTVCCAGAQAQGLPEAAEPPAARARLGGPLAAEAIPAEAGAEGAVEMRPAAPT